MCFVSLRFSKAIDGLEKSDLVVTRGNELLKDGDKVIVPSMTWVTNVSPIFQLGLTPIFCDINPHDYSFDKEYLKKLSKKYNTVLIFYSKLIV